MVALSQITTQETVFRYRTEGVEQTRAQADAAAKAQTALARSGEAASASGDRVEKSARGAAGALGGLASAGSDAARMQAALERAARMEEAAMAQAAATTGAYDQTAIVSLSTTWVGEA